MLFSSICSARRGPIHVSPKGLGKDQTTLQKEKSEDRGLGAIEKEALRLVCIFGLQTQFMGFFLNIF